MTARARLTGGVLVGAVLAALDAMLAPVHGFAASSAGLLVLLLLPGLGLLAAALALPLRGAATSLPLAAAAAWLGWAAARGPRAAAMPLSSLWWLIAAAGALALGLAWRRCEPRGWRWAAATIAATVVYLPAALLYRGLYPELREAAVTLAAVLVHPPLARATLRWRPRTQNVTIAAAVAGLVVALAVAATRQAPIDWADRGTTAAAPWARRIHALAARHEPRRPPGETEVAPFFGTPLAERTRAKLGVGGAPIEGVLLVVIDALRADMVGRTVAGRPVTPHLDRLAEGAAVFTRAYAPSSASHMSMLSALAGLYPSQILAQPGGAADVALVAERLAAAGVVTRAAFPSMLHNMRRPGFDRFELGFAEAWIHGDDTPPLARLGPRLLPSAEDERWFSYLHIATPHDPYDDAPPAFRAGDSEFELYAAEVRYSDDLVRRLLAELDGAGRLERALVVVTSDHGEEFGEHGATRHATQLYEESIHVPLLVCGPGVVPRRVDGPVSLADLAPTLDHVFGPGGADRPRYAGRSWVPLLVGEDDPGRPAEVLAEIPPLGDDIFNVLSALVGRRWKLIVDERGGRRYLFDLPADPDEACNLADREPERVRALRRRLEERRALPAAERSRVFADLDPTLRSYARGEEQDGVNRPALELARVAPLLPPELVERSLYYVAQGGDDAIVRRLLVDFGAHEDATIRRAVALLRLSIGLEGPADRADLVAFARQTADRFAHAALLDVFRRRHLAELRPWAEALGRDDLAVALPRAAYLATTGGPAPDAALVAKGLEAKNAWIRRHALIAAAAGSPARHRERLVAMHGTETAARVRAELVAALAGIADEQVDALLVRSARAAGRREACAALLALAERRPLPRAAVVPASLAEISGGAGVLGLIVEASPRLERAPRLVLRRGGEEVALRAARCPGRVALRAELEEGRGWTLEAGEGASVRRIVWVGR